MNGLREIWRTRTRRQRNAARFFVYWMVALLIVGVYDGTFVQQALVVFIGGAGFAAGFLVSYTRDSD